MESTVFVTFLDAIKSFYCIEQCLIFKKLNDKHIPWLDHYYFFSMLVFYSANSHTLGNTTTFISFVSDEIKQGVTLSSISFNVYMDQFNVKID